MYRGIVKRVSRQDIKLVTFSLEMKDKDQNEKCFSAGELSEYITCLNAGKKPLHDVLGFRKEINGTTVDIALQWCVDGYSYKMLGYANSIRTTDGGTHIDGVKASITRTLNRLAEKWKLVEDDGIILREEHVMGGLTCIVSVCVPKPEFEGQTQTRLGNPYVREIVDQSVEEYLTEYFKLHPDVLDGIISKSLNAYQTALAVQSLRDMYKSESVSTRGTIPKKLTNCASETSEVFIGRGNSSGGAAQHVPHRSFQSCKRTKEQLWSDDAVSTSGASLENTSDLYAQKKSKQPKPCVQGSHPCSSRKLGDVSNPPNAKEVSKKTSKDDINESKHPCSSRKKGDVSNPPNSKEVRKKTSIDEFDDSKEKRAFIPIGPGFQADIPVWIAPTKKGKFYGSPGDSNTLRWLGTGVWPTYSLKKQVYSKKVGEGRSDSCCCARPMSTNCIKQHIKEARELLEKKLTRAFFTWKFDQMGEEAGSKSWTAKEEQRFGTLVKKNPLSNSKQRFWELASASFPRKSHKDLISYYYNVYLIKRMRLLPNSSAADHVDSDDDHNDNFLAG